MRTIKQIKARKRNFTIMYLTGETQKDVKYECKESNQ